MFKMSVFGSNTSSLACWPLVNCISNQSVTAPSCTTQLHDVRGLPLPIRWSSKPVSCNFLNKFSIPLHFHFLSRNFLISGWAP